MTIKEINERRKFIDDEIKEVGAQALNLKQYEDTLIRYIASLEKEDKELEALLDKMLETANEVKGEI